jgi:hypothetical protein
MQRARMLPPMPLLQHKKQTLTHGGVRGATPMSASGRARRPHDDDDEDDDDCGVDIEELKALNPAHLKALLGQEVVMTLGDKSTRQGVVYSLDPESFTVVLASAAKGGGRNLESSGAGASSECVVIPGHAVRAVEVVGRNALTLDALQGSKSAGAKSVGALLSGLTKTKATAGDLEEVKTRAMKTIMGSRQNSWGRESTYAGMAILLKPTVNEQLECVRRSLHANMVPFEEVENDEGAGDVELVVLGSLVVRYPYTADSCTCANEIVLARVRELITAGCEPKAAVA